MLSVSKILVVRQHMCYHRGREEQRLYALAPGIDPYNPGQALTHMVRILIDTSILHGSPGSHLPPGDVSLPIASSCLLRGSRGRETSYEKVLVWEA